MLVCTCRIQLFTINLLASTVGGIITYWEFFITFKSLSLSLLYEWPYLLFQQLGRAGAGGERGRARFRPDQQMLSPSVFRSGFMWLFWYSLQVMGMTDLTHLQQLALKSENSCFAAFGYPSEGKQPKYLLTDRHCVSPRTLIDRTFNDGICLALVIPTKP